MTELKINLDDSYSRMIQSFKPVVDNIVEEDLTFDTYVSLLLWRGIRGMIEDIMPKDTEILLQSIVLMYEANPEFVASFIDTMLTAGEVREQAKERLGFLRDR